MMKKEKFLVLCLALCFLNCKVRQSKYSEMTDCQLISKIINQVGIIDENKCTEFIIIVNPDTISPLLKYEYRRSLNLLPDSIKKINFESCNNFYIDNIKSVYQKPYQYSFITGDTNPNSPIIPFESNQCYEILVSHIFKFKDYNAMMVRVANKKNSYFLDFIFKIDKIGNLSNIKIINFKPNKSRPNYKDLSKKYPTLKSKYWESFGLPDK